MENIKADYGYFTADEKMVSRRSIDKALEKIIPCYQEHELFKPYLDTKSILTIHLTHGFIWDQEKLDTYLVAEEDLPRTGWDAENEDGHA